jgi:hypothetical protein
LSKFSGKSTFFTWIYAIKYYCGVNSHANKKRQLAFAEEIKKVKNTVEVMESSDGEIFGNWD